MQELDTLEDKVKRTMDAMEKNCSYNFLQITNHLLRHAVGQVREHGVIRETWMYAFESAFGMNKHISMNPAYQVSSVAMYHSRKRALQLKSALR